MLGNRVLQLALLLILLSGALSADHNWISHGGNLENTRHARYEKFINKTSVTGLSLRWRFIAGDDISATPAVFEGIIYFPSWNGNIYAITADSGTLVWMKNLTELTGIPYGDSQRGENTTLCRSTPAIADERLILGLYGPAFVLAVNRSTGDLLWLKQLDNHPAGVITMSGTFHNGSYYIGTSSIQENFPELCCTFQGSFMRLDAETGEILWRTRMLPDNNGSQGLYAGASVWGSSPSIDTTRNLIFIGTGEMHSVPQAIQDCQAQQNNMTTPDFPNPCIEPDNHAVSILALDLNTGNITWYNPLGGYDAWVVACNSDNATVNATCPTPPNTDYDFSDAPVMLTIEYENQSTFYKREVVVGAQKSGKLWAVDRDTGVEVWSVVTGPGGGGGQLWGTPTDGKSIYANVPNSRSRNWTLTPGNTVITEGGWQGVNASTGAVLWSTPNPTQSPPIGPLSFTNGVVFGTSMDLNGTVFAIDGETGSILWNATTNATIYGGCSIANGCIFVGNGASTNVGRGYGGIKGDSLFAFCIPSAP